MINKTATTAIRIVFFDNEKGLRRRLNSIQGYVDLIIVIERRRFVTLIKSLYSVYKRTDLVPRT
jgi:hypothetical protein